MYLKYEDIEKMSEPQAMAMAIDTANVKGYTIYFADLGEYRGYSSLVFKNGAHIHYLDDFSNLHTSITSTDELKSKYIESLANKVYTEDELLQPLKDYTDYTKRAYYLRNYYYMDKEYVSAFFIVTPESEREHNKKIKGMIYNPIGFCYMRDEAFIKHHAELMASLEKLKDETKNDYEYQKKAFRYEMFNHEYAINWQADYDVLSAFGVVDYEDDINTMMGKLGFTDIQKQAYLDARREVYHEMNA